MLRSRVESSLESPRLCYNNRSYTRVLLELMRIPPVRCIAVPFVPVLTESDPLVGSGGVGADVLLALNDLVA